MITKAFADTDWHLSKTVTVSIIGVLIGLAGSLVGIYVAMREDIATIKEQMAEMWSAPCVLLSAGRTLHPHEL